MSACFQPWVGFLLELVLKFRQDFRASLEQTVLDREKLRSDLSRIPLVSRVHESAGNFLLACLASGTDTAAMIRRSLLAEFRIEVKNVTDRFPDALPRLRLAVRTQEENELLVAALATLAGRMRTITGSPSHIEQA